MKMVYAKNIDEAIEKAKAILQKPKCSITVIPDGVSVIVE